MVPPHTPAAASVITIKSPCIRPGFFTNNDDTKHNGSVRNRNLLRPSLGLCSPHHCRLGSMRGCMVLAHRLLPRLGVSHACGLWLPRACLCTRWPDTGCRLAAEPLVRKRLCAINSRSPPEDPSTFGPPGPTLRALLPGCQSDALASEPVVGPSLHMLFAGLDGGWTRRARRGLSHGPPARVARCHSGRTQGTDSASAPRHRATCRSPVLRHPLRHHLEVLGRRGITAALARARHSLYGSVCRLPPRPWAWGVFQVVRSVWHVLERLRIGGMAIPALAQQGFPTVCDTISSKTACCSRGGGLWA